MKSKRKYKKGPCFNYGVRLPDKEKSFADLDKENGDTQWADAIAYEIGCYDLRKVYECVGIATKELINKYKAYGYQQICLIWQYVIKHCGKRRAHL